MTEKADIKELAVAAWRLEKWLENLNSDRKMAAKSALRSIKKYISALDVEVIDPISSRFDPGLAVEVINNEAEEAMEDDLVIIETLSPYVYQKGELIQHARVIIGTDKKNKTEKPNCTVPETTEPPVIAPVDGAPADADNTLPDDTPETQSEETSEEKDEITIGEDEIERIMKYAKIL